MTNLSPAAQAVLQAACIHHGLFNEEIVQRRRNIAAALRAASHQLTSAKAIDTLIAIAAELEARHELDDREDYYWYPESVLLRHKVADALAVPDSTVLEQL